MTLKTLIDIKPDLEDDRSMKIYEISSHRGKEVDFEDDSLSSDDSDMKIYSIR